MSETPPLGLPARRGTNPPTPLLGTPAPGEEGDQSPPITPPNSSPLLQPDGGPTDSPITPPDSGPLPNDGPRGTSIAEDVTTSRPITPPVSGSPPQVGRKEGGAPRTKKGPRNIIHKKLVKEDYDRIFQKLDEIRRRGQRPKPPKGRFSHLPPSQIRHVKGASWNNSMAPDEKFAVQILQFPRHADSPQSNEFFDDLFSEANKIVTGFVLNNYGGFDIKPDEFGGEHPWNEINVSSLFISLVELVEDDDPDDPRSWDSLLLVETKRNMMVMGMIARIFLDKLFSPLLFGCTPNQATMLNALENEMANNGSLEGFARTKTRSRAIREILDGNAVPIHFYDEVKLVSLNIFELLNPVSVYLEKYVANHPNLNLSIPSRADRFASLFDMVSGTAWLSILRRVHPEPIILRMSEPGDEFKVDLDLCANHDEYCANKARILKLQYNRLGEELEHERLEQEGASPEDLPPTEILKERMWYVKTAIWPSVKIYSPVYAEGPHDQSGVAEYRIQKCEAAAQWVVPRGNRTAIIPPLEEWAKLT